MASVSFHSPSEGLEFSPLPTGEGWGGAYRIQLVVVSAVRNAVRAATIIFTVISINFAFFMFVMVMGYRL